MTMLLKSSKQWRPERIQNKLLQRSQLHYQGEFQHLSIIEQQQPWQCSQNLRGPFLKAVLPTTVNWSKCLSNGDWQEDKSTQNRVLARKRLEEGAQHPNIRGVVSLRVFPFFVRSVNIPCAWSISQASTSTFTAAACHLGCHQLESQPEPEATTASTSEMTESSSGIHRGGVTSWCNFRAEKYLKKHEWLLIRPEGIYCMFCTKIKPSIQSGSSVFITRLEPNSSYAHVGV